jgi:hypothetical protein
MMKNLWVIVKKVQGLGADPLDSDEARIEKSCSSWHLF